MKRSCKWNTRIPENTGGVDTRYYLTQLFLSFGPAKSAWTSPKVLRGACLAQSFGFASHTKIYILYTISYIIYIQVESHLFVCAIGCIHQIIRRRALGWTGQQLQESHSTGLTRAMPSGRVDFHVHDTSWEVH